MVLTIPFEDFNSDIKKAYANGEIKSIAIDYQYNGLYGFIGDKEVELYSFNKFFRADNRYNTYEIYCGPTQIMIEIVGT